MMPLPNHHHTQHPASLSDSAHSGSEVSKKRSRQDDNDVLSPEALATMSRSERKRHREKKRRNDVNKGFDDLMALLIEIDPVIRAEHEDRVRRGGPTADEHLLSRVELIARTTEVLRRVPKENEERKLIIHQLLQKPVVAAAPGATVGLGLQQALHKVSPQRKHSNCAIIWCRRIIFLLCNAVQCYLYQQPSLTAADLSILAGATASQPTIRPIPTVLDPAFQQRLGGLSVVGTITPDELRLLTNAQILSRPSISLPTPSVNYEVELALSKIQQKPK